LGKKEKRKNMSEKESKKATETKGIYLGQAVEGGKGSWGKIGGYRHAVTFLASERRSVFGGKKGGFREEVRAQKKGEMEEEKTHSRRGDGSRRGKGP